MDEIDKFCEENIIVLIPFYRSNQSNQVGVSNTNQELNDFVLIPFYRSNQSNII